MNEGVGEAVSLALVMFFIVVISSYLAFTINYSKAFKVKSKLIDTIQKYNNDPTNKKVITEMKTYIDDVGYSASDERMKYQCAGDGRTTGYKVGLADQGWCYQIFEENTAGKGNNKDLKRRYVKVKTFVAIDIPVINRIFGGIRVFTVEGSTKALNITE